MIEHITVFAESAFDFFFTFFEQKVVLASSGTFWPTFWPLFQHLAPSMRKNLPNPVFISSVVFSENQVLINIQMIDNNSILSSSVLLCQVHSPNLL